MKPKKEKSLAEERLDLCDENGKLDGLKILEALKKAHGGKDIVPGVYVDFSSQEYQDKLKNFPLT